MSPVTIMLIGLIVFGIIVLFSTIRIVPQKKAFLVERLGKFRETLTAGFHILIPFITETILEIAPIKLSSIQTTISCPQPCVGPFCECLTVI